MTRAIDEGVRAVFARPPIEARLLEMRADDGVTIAVLDTGAGQLAIEWWRGRPERASFRDGRILRFAYRGASEGVDLARVTEIIDALVEQESALAPVIARPEQPVRQGRILFLRETDLAMRAALARATRARSVAQAIEAVLDSDGAAPLERVMVYFETRCQQACEFCEEPGRRDRPLARIAARGLRVQHATHTDLVSLGAIDAVLAWMHARPERPALHVTGHDWLAHPHLDALLASLERNPGVPLWLQGPSLALADRSLTRRVAMLPHLERIATTLQSSDPAEHDAIVGREGAHRQLVAALDALEGEGARVWLTVVLTRRTLRTLPSTLQWLGARGTSAQLQAFIPDRAMRDPEPAFAPLDELHHTLDAIPAGAHAAIASLVGVPPCAVPESLRPKLAPAIDTDARDRASFGRACERCAARAGCSGVPARYLAYFGERGLAPID